VDNQAFFIRDENEDQFVRRFAYWYAYLITGLTFLFIIFDIAFPILFTDKGDDIPIQTWSIINTVVGFLLGVGLSAIIQYDYGSSMDDYPICDRQRVSESEPFALSPSSFGTAALPEHRGSAPCQPRWRIDPKRLFMSLRVGRLPPGP
jgi:hypothetical protein